MVSLLLALALHAPADTVEVRDVLDHVGRHVIVATYADLAREAARLDSAVVALAAAPTDAGLDAARAHWRATRTPWEQTEAFIFGPVTFAGLDPSLDTWPLNVVDLEAVLASDYPLDADGLRALDVTTRGFHAIEYLLWGDDGQKHATSLTPRELAYLTSTTRALAADARELHAAWLDSAPDGGYAAVLRTAGDPGNRAYATVEDALYELLMGILFIVTEVADEKLHVPLLAGTGVFAESRFSQSSKADILDNLRSVAHVYEGTYAGAHGPGLSHLVAARSPDLDARFRAELEAAEAAVAAIPGTLEAAVAENPAPVAAAKEAVWNLLRFLENEMIVALVDA